MNTLCNAYLIQHYVQVLITIARLRVVYHLIVLLLLMNHDILSENFVSQSCLTCHLDPSPNRN